MFICIIHGDKQQFLVNINCNVIHLLSEMRKRLQLPMTDIIDLCDEKGSLKFLFLIRNDWQSAANVLTPYETYYICKIVRGEQGSKHGHCYQEITLILSSPDPKLTDALRAQCDLLEKSRLKLLKSSQPTVRHLPSHSSNAFSQQSNRGPVKSSEEEKSELRSDTRSQRGKTSGTFQRDRQIIMYTTLR
ncbi:uncharacterized protein CXorf65 homolog [Ranitomeya variabilis]|uniref:uncharacterized protein CXorf65 homolog n=1 Tax=Ranitomeya variabilis TaxID=490064 RepID=UPI00405760D8